MEKCIIKAIIEDAKNVDETGKASSYCWSLIAHEKVVVSHHFEVLQCCWASAAGQGAPGFRPSNDEGTAIYFSGQDDVWLRGEPIGGDVPMRLLPLSFLVVEIMCWGGGAGGASTSNCTALCRWYTLQPLYATGGGNACLGRWLGCQSNGLLCPAWRQASWELSELHSSRPTASVSPLEILKLFLFWSPLPVLAALPQMLTHG